MPEPAGSQNEDSGEPEEKNAFYAAALEAWFLSRLEHDKSLLTLSAGGIGLLITLVSTVGINSTESLILFILALLAFVFCLAAVLWIFKRNSTHIEDAVKRGVAKDEWLTVLDNAAILSFLAGVVFSGIIGISSAVSSLKSKETTMANDRKVTTTGTIYVGDSVNGLMDMRPGQSSSGRSLNGIANLAPTSPQNAQQPQAAQTQPASQAAAAAVPAASTKK
jgi:hypothetical protein